MGNSEDRFSHNKAHIVFWYCHIVISNFTAGMAAQTITTAVTANPHHFQSAPVSQSAYQNGVGGASDGHVMMPKSHDPQDSQSQQSEQTSQSINLANTKEKTPMCLINELARFNKVNCSD